MDRGDFLLGVGTLVGGVLLAVLVEFLRGQIEREQRRDDQRDDFQRDTLLELQAAMFHFIEAAAHIVEDYRDESAGRLRRSALRGENWDTVGRITQARVVMLTVRVKDKQLRQLVEQYKIVFRESYRQAVTAEDAEAALRQAREIYDRANERIGELLRSL